MGVKDLWAILSPTCERKSLYDLQGKAIAVDLSCWVVEDQTVASYSTQPRMYLRNLFFRTTCLLMLNVKPVFILEGNAPTLKHGTMARRKDAQHKSHLKHHGPSQSQPSQSQNNPMKGTRSRLKSLLKQCEAMLRVMGVSCVQSDGEAEALCAQLNAAGLVEGCITQDGDCFLYGAHKVYRNFTISTAGASASSGFSVDVFDMAQVRQHLSLGRNKLVALALLLGCDYAPGVSGVGKVAAVAFLDAIDEADILDRMRRWRTDPYFECLERDPKGLRCDTPEERKTILTELSIRKKALEDLEFPSQEVIAEFLDSRPIPEDIDLDWHEPCLPRFVQLSVAMLAWTESYAVKKFFPLLTRWQVTHLAATAAAKDFPFAPTAIAKKRVQKGVASYELRWADREDFLSTLTLDDDETAEELLVSVEPQALVDRAFPLLVAEYEAALLAKKLNKKKSTRKGKENVDVQPRIDVFLKPNELPQNATSSIAAKPQKAVRAAVKKPVKKPQVTIASLMKQMAAIERNKAASQILTEKPARRNANKLAAKSKSASSPLKKLPGNYLSGVSSPRMSPIPVCGKRFASPRLKVGFKTRKMSTPGKRLSIQELERSFRNVSIMDYSEDDGEFSDLSAIIDGIVGFSDDDYESGDRDLEFQPAGNVIVKRDCDRTEAFEHARTVLEVIETETQPVDVESEDEFDFCNLEIVPLHIKLGSQLLFK